MAMAMATDSGMATEAGMASTVAYLVADTTARGRLRLSPRLMLTLVMVPMVPMVLVMDVLMAMASATPTPTAFTTARGRLRLSPRLMLTLVMVPMVPMVLAMDVLMAMASATPTPTTMESTARGRLMLRPSPTTDLDTAATDMPVPIMATAAMAVDTTGDKSSDHTSP